MMRVKIYGTAETTNKQITVMRNHNARHFLVLAARYISSKAGSHWLGATRTNLLALCAIVRPSTAIRGRPPREMCPQDR